MSEQNLYSFQNGASKEIDVGKLMRYILMQSKMIALFTFFAFAIFTAIYLSSTKFYKVSSLLQIESFNQNSLDPTNSFQMMGSMKSSSDLQNLMKLYTSRANLVQMISDLNLNVQIENISDKEIVDIQFVNKNLNDLSYAETFYILPTNNSIKVYKDKGKDLLVEANYGQEINIFNQLTFVVKFVNLETNRLLKIKYKNPVSLYPRFKNSITLKSNIPRSFISKTEGLIEASFITADINKGKKILNYANKIFINQRVNAETEKSRAAITFIDENLIGLQQTVNRNKENLKEFRELNKSINLDLETQVIIDTVQSLDQALNEIEVELANASETYTLNNPVYINLLGKKNIFINKKNEILSKIKVMPKEQQEYIDLFNQVEITQNLLAELETRRLGFFNT